MYPDLMPIPWSSSCTCRMRPVCPCLHTHKHTCACTPVPSPHTRSLGLRGSRESGDTHLWSEHALGPTGSAGGGITSSPPSGPSPLVVKGGGLSHSLTAPHTCTHAEETRSEHTSMCGSPFLGASASLGLVTPALDGLRGRAAPHAGEDTPLFAILGLSAEHPGGVGGGVSPSCSSRRLPRLDSGKRRAGSSAGPPRCPSLHLCQVDTPFQGSQHLQVLPVRPEALPPPSVPSWSLLLGTKATDKDPPARHEILD